VPEGAGRRPKEEFITTLCGKKKEAKTEGKEKRKKSHNAWYIGVPGEDQQRGEGKLKVRLENAENHYCPG